MDWNEFLKPTFGKILMTVFFNLIPIPLPAQLAAQNAAKYSPLMFFPFLTTQTIPAYFAIMLIIVLFYILSCLLSHIYHKHVISDKR